MPNDTDALPRQLALIAVLVFLLVGGILAGSMPGEIPPNQSQQPTVGADGSVSQLHDAGVTGSEVRVGVVDVTGFDTDAPELRSRVADARSFGHGDLEREPTAHGTAAASLLAATAPDAELYLASVGTEDDFENAVRWLLRVDVDVVVAPVAFYGKPGDGSSDVAAAAALAAEADVVFVAPAGNLGESHWQGRFDPTDRGEHRFGNATRNDLEGDGERLTLWLSWNERQAHHDLVAELHRDDGEESRLVARSQPYPGDDAPNARIVARVDPTERYSFAIRGPGEATGTHVRVVSPTHTLERGERSGSLVAPAAASDAVTVGAYDARTDRMTPFSSAGPTDDGRAGVDLVADGEFAAAGAAEGFVGTSAAATYVGGVAALLLEANPELTAEDVESVLEATAIDVDEPGAVAGSGRVDPAGAVASASNATAGDVTPDDDRDTIDSEDGRADGGS